MKRIFLAAGVLAVLTAAWTLYPSRAHAGRAADGGYMLVISRYTVNNALSSKGKLSTVMPNGQVQSWDIETKIGSPANVSYSLDLLHFHELQKLNELRAAGWRVKTTTQTSESILNETMYLLEKE